MSYDVSNVGEDNLTTSGAELSQMFTHDRLGKLSNNINHTNKSAGGEEERAGGEKTKIKLQICSPTVTLNN